MLTLLFLPDYTMEVSKNNVIPLRNMNELQKKAIIQAINTRWNLKKKYAKDFFKKLPTKYLDIFLGRIKSKKIQAIAAFSIINNIAFEFIKDALLYIRDKNRNSVTHKQLSILNDRINQLNLQKMEYLILLDYWEMDQRSSRYNMSEYSKRTPKPKIPLAYAYNLTLQKVVFVDGSEKAEQITRHNTSCQSLNQHSNTHPEPNKPSMKNTKVLNIRKQDLSNNHILINVIEDTTILKQIYLSLTPQDGIWVTIE